MMTEQAGKVRKRPEIEKDPGRRNQDKRRSEILERRGTGSCDSRTEAGQWNSGTASRVRARWEVAG